MQFFTTGPRAGKYKKLKNLVLGAARQVFRFLSLWIVGDNNNNIKKIIIITRTVFIFMVLPS